MEIREYGALGEKLCYERLENGLSIFVTPKNNYHKAYAFFAVKYGGSDRCLEVNGERHETPSGIAHYLEHKMFDKKDGNALTELSANGASPNAFTGAGITAYHFECADNFEENLKILLEFVTQPYFTDESVDKERGIISQEIRMVEDEPDHRVYTNLMRLLYSDNPIKEPIAGTVESIQDITAQTLYDCHRIFYTPSNMVLCVAGNADPERVISIAKETVTANQGEVPQRDYGKDGSRAPVKEKAEEYMSIARPLFMIGSKLELKSGSEYQRQGIVGDIAMDVMLGPSSPFYSRLYSEGLINRSFYQGVDNFPGGALAVVGGESDEPEKVFEQVMQEAERFVREGADSTLLDRVKKAALGGWLRSLNYLDDICYDQADAYFKGYEAFSEGGIIAAVSEEDVVSFVKDAFLDNTPAVSVLKPIED